MENWNIDKLTFFILFFIPGFISTKIYDLIIAGEKRDFTKSIFETIVFSSINFGLLLPFIIYIHSSNFPHSHFYWYLAVMFIIIFITPILWPFVFLKLIRNKFLSKHFVHPIPKAWDYYFSKRESCWVLIHLRNGQKIGGLFAKNSFASSYPAPEQIYLEEVWKIGDNSEFLHIVDSSKGVILQGSDILIIEFLSGSTDVQTTTK